MDPSTADRIESLRGLALKLDDALNAGMMKLFRRFAHQRLRTLRLLYGHPGQVEGLEVVLAQCVAEDRRWLDLAKKKRAGLREELDKILVRQNGLKQLAKAYDHPTRSGQIYSKKS